MPQVTALQENHIKWLKNYFAKSIFIAAGRKIPHTGGVILAHSMAQDELERILAEDPFTAVADYDITKFMPTMTDEKLAELMTL